MQYVLLLPEDELFMKLIGLIRVGGQVLAVKEATDHEAQLRKSEEQVAGLHEQLKHAEAEIRNFSAEQNRLAQDLNAAEAISKASSTATTY